MTIRGHIQPTQHRAGRLRAKRELLEAAAREYVSQARSRTVSMETVATAVADLLAAAKALVDAEGDGEAKAKPKGPANVRRNV